MEQLTVGAPTGLGSLSDLVKSSDDGSVESKLISSINDSQNDDAVGRVNVNLDGVYKSLTVLADEVIKKLDELLGDKVPGGVRSLKPEEHTPEATSDRIVQGVTGLFAAFERQNPDLEGEALVNKFLDTVRGGIKSGYESAMGSLKDIGALQFDGVQSGIDETMTLVEKKLQAFADQYFGKAADQTNDQGPAQDGTENSKSTD